MDINEQTDALLFDLQNAVNRFHKEFELNHATIIGCLEMVKLDYLTEPSEDVEFEEDDEEDETVDF